ncbi:MAG: hypothetical protein JJT90_18330 [Ectothiorhodospiraceae bacterium]|nr:hypothetical protein [Ectothiorhodospiraceae bacterium]
MDHYKFTHGAVAAPGILAIFSNRPHVPNFPLVRKLPRITDTEAKELDLPVQVAYHVGGTTPSEYGPGMKTFRKTEKSLIQETPVGRFARLSVELTCNPHRSTIAVNRFYHAAARITVGNVHSCGWLLRDLCNIQLLHHGYALLYAAAIRRGQRAILIIGLSNTGKTTTVVDLVKSGNTSFYGDDLVITNGRQLFSCPFAVANMSPKKGMGLQYRATQWAKKTIPFFENFGASIPYSIGDYLGMKNQAEPTEISEILFLEKSEKSEQIDLSEDAATSLLISSNRTEFTYATSPVFCAAEHMGVGFEVTTLVSREAELLRDIVKRCRCSLIRGRREEFNAAADRALDG